SQDQASPVDQAAARIAARVASLQSQLTSLDAQLQQASGKVRPTLKAKREEMSAALDLAKEIQGTVGQIQRFEATTEAHASGTSGGLAGQIADLRRSVPELHRQEPAAGSGSAPGNSAGAKAGDGGSSGSSANSTPTAPAKTRAAINTETFRPESAGIIALFGKWFSLQGMRRELADTLKQTDALQKDLEAIRTGATKEARVLAAHNLEATSDDPTQLLQSKLKFQEAADRFKQLSTLLVPLGEQDITLDNARGT